VDAVNSEANCQKVSGADSFSGAGPVSVGIKGLAEDAEEPALDSVGAGRNAMLPGVSPSETVSASREEGAVELRSAELSGKSRVGEDNDRSNKPKKLLGKLRSSSISTVGRRRCRADRAARVVRRIGENLLIRVTETQHLP
jgi:hypothetical protein